MSGGNSRILDQTLFTTGGRKDTLLDQLDILQHSCVNLNFEKQWRMSVEKSTNKG